jgi:biopolymer transport protein ExbD
LGRYSSNAHEIGNEGAEGELNLVPYLDIMVNLVMFMLFSFQVVLEMNVIDLVTPAYGAAAASAATDTETKNRVITLVVTDSGYTLLSSDEAMARVDIPRLGTSYDNDQLRVKAAEWKANYQLGTSLVLTASRDIQYKDIVAAMDAVRMDGDRFLFPDVLLAATNEQADAAVAPPAPAATP